MTNEELVQRIRDGDKDLILELWKQNKGLCVLKARNVWADRRENGRADVDMDDLMQAGFLALVDAVERFDPEAGFRFSTVFTNRLKTYFAEATGYLSEKQQKDPIHLAGSLEAPLSAEPEGATVGDLVADPTDQYGSVDERLYREWLRGFLRQEVDKLPPEQRETIRVRYYRNLTLAETGAAIGADTDTARHREAKALRALRRSKNIRALGAYLDGRTDFYYHVGAHSGLSPVEEIVCKRETWAEEWQRNVGKC